MRKSLRILYADDDSTIGAAVTEILSAAGHLVDLAINGQKAWEKLIRDLGHFDVLVTDHEMPEMTGLELVRLLRRTSHRSRVVVLCSPLVPRDQAEFRALAVDAILEKPVCADALVNAIRVSG